MKSFHMKTSQKGIMSCAGSIRGAIAFGLAISIETSNQLHKEILVGSTLILVFFTTIVFGAIMPLMINLMKKLDGPEERQDIKVEEESCYWWSYFFNNSNFNYCTYILFYCCRQS